MLIQMYRPFQTDIIRAELSSFKLPFDVAYEWIKKEY